MAATIYVAFHCIVRGGGGDQTTGIKCRKGREREERNRKERGRETEREREKELIHST
jgi:hypothetical protein